MHKMKEFLQHFEHGVDVYNFCLIILKFIEVSFFHSLFFIINLNRLFEAITYR